MDHEEIPDLIELQAKLFAKSPDIDKVLVLVTMKNGDPISMDNGLTVMEAHWICSQFQFWIMKCVMGEGKRTDGDD